MKISIEVCIRLFMSTDLRSAIYCLSYTRICRMKKRDILLVLCHSPTKSSTIITEEVTKCCTITLEKAGTLSLRPTYNFSPSVLITSLVPSDSRGVNNVLLGCPSASSILYTVNLLRTYTFTQVPNNCSSPSIFCSSTPPAVKYMNSVTMTARVQEFEEIDRTFDESIFYHQLTQVFKMKDPIVAAQNLQ